MPQTRRQYGRHCSWCFKKGHNKRTCPAYTAYLKKQAEQHGGYSLSKYVKRTGEMPDGSKPTGELAVVKETAKKASKRRCSWCVKMRMVGEGYGHNRRTCPHRKTWHADQTRDSRELRQSILNRAEALGVGMGSLVLAKKYVYDGSGFGWQKVVGMVVKVDNSLKALNKGVQKIHIISGEIKNALITELETEEGIGTVFQKNELEY